MAEYGPVVLRVCRAVLGPDADDAWSETFLAALRAYPDLPPDSNVEAWLVTIAHRKAVDQRRAENRRPVPTGELPDVPDAKAPPTGLDTELWDALRALPTRQRETVAYHYVAGLPYAQIATVLDTNEVAARRAAADGIRKLRSIYRKGDGDE